MRKQTLKASKNSFKIQIQVLLFEEHGTFVAYCPALALSSYGDDEEDAKKAFDLAMNIFLKDTLEKGTLEKYLLKLGWQLRQKPITSYQPPAFSLKESQKFFDKKPSVYNENVTIPIYA